MKKRLNKIPTNYTVALTPQEVTNLSETLSAVRTAGGGTGGVYIGDGQYIGVDNTNNKISFLPDAATKLESVSNKLDESTYAADSATFLTAHQSLSGYYQKTETSSKEQLSTEFEKYQTVAGMAEYLTTSNAQTTYLTKSSAEENLAPISVTADVDVLKANSGNLSQYYKKTETSSKEELSAEFNKYQTKADMESYATDQEVVDLRLNLEQLISSKQPKLTFGYNENNAISSINDSALAGQGGTTYSAGAGIAIVDEYISISADYIQAITQVSGKQDKLEFTYDNSGSIIKINNSAIAGGAGGSVSYTGRNGVEINGNYIELETTAKTAIDSVGGIETDVGTLKTASAGWDKVSDKLDTTAFSTVSGTFLTTIPDTYATKDYANNASANALSEAETWVENKHYLTEVPNTYALKTDIPTTVAQLTDSGNYYQKTETSSKDELSDEFAKYVTSSNVTTQDTDYVMTTTGWKVLTLPGGGMTQVIHDETLTGQGNDANSKLSVAWSALSGNTINSALSAGSATSADKAVSASASKRLQDSTSGPVIQVGDVTALQNWASSNSSTWDSVSAKLTTAQYAIDSATFVTKPDTTQTVLNNNYLIYSTLTGEGTTTGWMPLSANYYSKTEADGRYVATADVGSGLYYSGSSPKLGVKLGTDLAFNATTSAIQINTDGSAWGAYAFVEGKNTSASGAGAHAEGADAGAFGQGAHAGGYGTHTTGVGNFIHGTFLNFASPDGTTVSNTPVFVGGTLNATTAQNYNDHGGYLQIMGNGTYTGDGRGNNSDAYILYRDGSISAAGKISANGMFAVDSAATLIGASRQTSSHYGVDTTALGTTWVGVGGAGMYRGFLKYTQGGNVGDLDTDNTMQVEFTPTNKGAIFAKAKNNGTDCPETQILNPVKTTCDNMSASGIDANNMSGPNYMIAKNADGQFVIGAAVFNCQGNLPGTLQPNTYYFVY